MSGLFKSQKDKDAEVAAKAAALVAEIMSKVKPDPMAPYEPRKVVAQGVDYDATFSGQTWLNGAMPMKISEGLSKHSDMHSVIFNIHLNTLTHYNPLHTITHHTL
jgi:hypothetical protein